MKKLLLVSTALYAVAALSVGNLAAAEQPGTVLWNQNHHRVSGFPSDNCSTSASCDLIAADDFVIPSGQRWHIHEVDVTGTYHAGGRPASSENVTFYADGGGMPGGVLKAYDNMVCKDSSGNFSCRFGKTGPVLKGGAKGTRYWVSVVANCYGGGGCEGRAWEWTENAVVHGKGAVFNQGRPDWQRIGTDLAFMLIGRP